jgi:hypothetical protein
MYRASGGMFAPVSGRGRWENWEWYEIGICGIWGKNPVYVLVVYL